MGGRGGRGVDAGSYIEVFVSQLSNRLLIFSVEERNPGSKAHAMSVPSERVGCTAA